MCKLEIAIEEFNGVDKVQRLKDDKRFTRSISNGGEETSGEDEECILHP